MEIKDVQQLGCVQLNKVGCKKTETACVQTFIKIVEEGVDVLKSVKGTDSGALGFTPAPPVITDINEEIARVLWQTLKSAAGPDTDSDTETDSETEAEEHPSNKNKKTAQKQIKQKYPKQWR